MSRDLKPLSQRIFLWALLAYPRDYRERDAVGMEYAFAKQLGEMRQRGKLAVCVFWVRTLSHSLLFGLCERLSRCKRSRFASNKGGGHRVSPKAGGWARRCGQEMRYAVRTLAKAPLVTAMAVLSLALGIGANTAIFSMFDQLLLQSLPVEEPDRLVNFTAPGPRQGARSANLAGNGDGIFSYPMFRDLERAGGGFSGIAAHRLFRANLSYVNTTVKAQGLLVSGSYFPVLGVRPALGRLLGPADDQMIGEHFVAVLSHRYWANQLGSDPKVLDQAVVVNGQPMTIVGVAPRGFDGTTLGARADVFVLISMRSRVSRWFDGFDNRRDYWAYLFGRLSPGVTLDQAAAELNTVYSGIINEVEAPLQEEMSEQTLERFRAKKLVFEEGRRGQSVVHGNLELPLTLLFTITGVVLLIACANIANLLLAQGANRSQEMAVRGSLGASRVQLLSQLLMESSMLAALGGFASIAVAQGTLGVVASIFPAEAAGMVEIDLRPSVVLFAAGVSIGTGFLFGMYPALHSTRPDLMSLVRSGAGQPSGGRTAARFRSSLVTAQIGLSTALLLAAGLFIKSLGNVSRVDLGLNVENVVSFGISPELNGYELEDAQVLFRRLEEELAAIPGVSRVTAALLPLFTSSNWGSSVSVSGFESGPDVDDRAQYNVIGAGYFNTLDVPILAGREFRASDVVGSPKVAIVNEVFANKFGLEGREAIGKWMSDSRMASDLDMEIVGLVGATKYDNVKAETPALFFTPYRQNDWIGSLTFYVRTSVDPASVMRAIPHVVGSLDANLPVEELKTFEQQVAENIALDRFISTLSTSFAILATVLAAVGLYGVLAYAVALRTRELGLRMALGANSRRVRGMVLLQVGRMTVFGGVCGIVVGLAVGRAARSLLYGYQGMDILTVATVVLLVTMVAFCAGYIPARRASKVDPMGALRYE